MGSNVHPNLLCAGNMTWRSRSVQCCICCKLVHPSAHCSKFSSLELPSLALSVDNTVTSSSGLHNSTVQSDNPALPSHHRFQTFYLLPQPPHQRFMLLAVSKSHSLLVLRWNAGGLRARSTELLHFLSSHPVDHICIQESNLNLFSSFQIPGFSAI